MPYTVTDWVDGVTPVNAANLDKLEAGVADAVASDEVQTAGTRIVANKLLLADAQPSFRILGDGKIEWGNGGASAVDTNLYRFAADALATDDRFRVFRAGAGDGAYTASVTADAQSRLVIRADGFMTWGDGSVVGDTTLYRSAADVLKTDDNFEIGPAGKTALRLTNTGTDTGLTIGADTNLYRSAANTLKTDDSLQVNGNLTVDHDTTGDRLYFGGSGDTSLFRSAADTLSTEDTLVISKDGAGSNSLQLTGTTAGNGLLIGGDVNLYRNGANVLQTDDSLVVGGSLTLGTNLAVSEMGSGTPSAGKYLDGAGSWTALPVTIPTTRVVSGTTDTPVIGDANNIIETSSASATTITIPLNSSVAYPIGTTIDIIQTGAGQVTIAAGGTTLNGYPGLKLSQQWATATLLKRGTDTWVLFGSLAA
jgi:hypothetical protein